MTAIVHNQTSAFDKFISTAKLTSCVSEKQYSVFEQSIKFIKLKYDEVNELPTIVVLRTTDDTDVNKTVVVNLLTTTASITEASLIMSTDDAETTDTPDDRSIGIDVPRIHWDLVLSLVNNHPLSTALQTTIRAFNWSDLFNTIIAISQIGKQSSKIFRIFSHYRRKVLTDLTRRLDCLFDECVHAVQSTSTPDVQLPDNLIIFFIDYALHHGLTTVSIKYFLVNLGRLCDVCNHNTPHQLRPSAFEKNLRQWLEITPTTGDINTLTCGYIYTDVEMHRRIGDYIKDLFTDRTVDTQHINRDVLQRISNFITLIVIRRSTLGIRDAEKPINPALATLKTVLSIVNRTIYRANLHSKYTSTAMTIEAPMVHRSITFRIGLTDHPTDRTTINPQQSTDSTSSSTYATPIRTSVIVNNITIVANIKGSFLETYLQSYQTDTAASHTECALQLTTVDSIPLMVKYLETGSIFPHIIDDSSVSMKTISSLLMEAHRQGFVELVAELLPYAVQTWLTLLKYKIQFEMTTTFAPVQTRDDVTEILSAVSQRLPNVDDYFGSVTRQACREYGCIGINLHLFHECIMNILTGVAMCRQSKIEYDCLLRNTKLNRMRYRNIKKFSIATTNKTQSKFDAIISVAIRQNAANSNHIPPGTSDIDNTSDDASSSSSDDDDDDV